VNDKESLLVLNEIIYCVSYQALSMIVGPMHLLILIHPLLAVDDLGLPRRNQKQEIGVEFWVPVKLHTSYSVP
jgi:hypothetical protein